MTCCHLVPLALTLIVMQALSEDQEDASRLTVSKYHGGVFVVECGLLEWLALTAMDVGGVVEAHWAEE